MWISAVAPIVDGHGRAVALLSVDCQVDVFLDRLTRIHLTSVDAADQAALAALRERA